MNIYILLTIILLVLMLLNVYIGKANFFLLSINAVFSLFMGLRSVTVGSDTLLYKEIYNSMASNPLSSPLFWKFPIYNVYSYIIARVFNSFQAELIINAIIINTIVLFFIKKHSPNIFLSVFLYYTLYFFFTGFNISRQCLALGFCLLFLHFLIEKKVIKALMCLIIAFGIHTTAIVTLLFIPLIYIHWTKRNFLITITGIAAMSIFSSKFISLFMSLFSEYNIYANGASTTLSAQNEGNRVFLSLFYVSLIVISFIYSPKNIKLENVSEERAKYIQKYYLFLVLSSLGTMISLIFNRDILILRIESYFSIFLIILLPYTMKEISRKSGAIQEFMIKNSICILTLVPFFVQLVKNIGGILPYMFFWQ